MKIVQQRYKDKIRFEYILYNKTSVIYKKKNSARKLIQKDNESCICVATVKQLWKATPYIGENYRSNELDLTAKGSEEANLNCYEYQLYLFSQRRKINVSFSGYLD
jgi:hypothetical protein